MVCDPSGLSVGVDERGVTRSHVGLTHTVAPVRSCRSLTTTESWTSCLTLTHLSSRNIMSPCHLQTGNRSDKVASFYVFLWDGRTSSCISLLGELYGALEVLHICAKSAVDFCPCGQPVASSLCMWTRSVVLLWVRVVRIGGSGLSHFHLVGLSFAGGVGCHFSVVLCVICAGCRSCGSRAPFLEFSG